MTRRVIAFCSLLRIAQWLPSHLRHPIPAITTKPRYTANQLKSKAAQLGNTAIDFGSVLLVCERPSISTLKSSNIFEPALKLALELGYKSVRDCV